jgi:hypothetical protein
MSKGFRCTKERLERCRAACCGPVPIPLGTWHRLRSLARDAEEIVQAGDVVVPRTADGSCVFLDLETYACRVYDDRPEVCRLFGTAPHVLLECPEQDTRGRSRTPWQRKQHRARVEAAISATMKRLEVGNG